MTFGGSLRCPPLSVIRLFTLRNLAVQLAMSSTQTTVTETLLTRNAGILGP